MEPTQMIQIINTALPQETKQIRSDIEKYLIQKGYKTLDQLIKLEVDDWMFLADDLLTIKKVNQLRTFLKKVDPKSQIHKNSFSNQLTSSEKEKITKLFNSKRITLEQIMDFKKSKVNSSKDKLILKYLKLLLRPLKPVPTHLKLTQIKRQSQVLPVYLYPGKKQWRVVRYYTFLVIGAPGTGKTTLLDLIINRIMGIQYTDNWRYKLVDQSCSDFLTKSENFEPKVYYINDPANKFNIKIIDTPGLSDTQGNNKMQISKKFQELFKTNDCIDYILFTNKASDQKLSKDAMFIYNQIQNLFRKNIQNGTLLMCTHSQQDIAPKCLQAMKESNFKYQEYFCFNNGALFNSARINQDDWDLGMENVDKLMKYVLQKEERTNKVLMECITAPSGLQKSIQKTQHYLKFQINQLQQNKHYLQCWIKSKKSIIEKGQFAFIEQVRQVRQIKKQDGCYQMCIKCNVTCCQSCIWPEGATISQCTYFRYGKNCPVCPGKCPITTHVRTYELMQVKWVQKVIIKTNFKQNYPGKTNEEIYYLQIQKTIAKIDQNTKQIWKFAADIKINVKKLNQTTNQPQNSQEQMLYQRIIEQQQQNQEPGWQQRVNYLNEVRYSLKICQDIEKADFLIENLFPEIRALRKNCLNELPENLRVKVEKK